MSEFESMLRWSELTMRQLQLMQASQLPRGDAVLEQWRQMIVDFTALRDSVPEDDRFVKRREVEERLADSVDWYGRALEAAGRHDEALPRYEEALDEYRRLGKDVQVGHVEDRIAEVRLHLEQDYDAALTHWHGRLDTAPSGSTYRIEVLLRLGEMCTQLGDESGALRWLADAEAALDPTPPTADGLMDAMLKAVAAIQDGMAQSDRNPLLDSFTHRMLHRRLYLAYSQAYRRSDPDLSAEYAERARGLDAQRNSPVSPEQIAALLKGFGE